MAMAFLATFARRIFIGLNIFTAFLFLLACANWYINPGDWWFVALLGLVFPFMLVAHILFFAIWLILKSRWAFLSLAVLIIGFTNTRALIGTTIDPGFALEKDENTLRVLSWNVHQFTVLHPAKKGLLIRQEMLDYVRSQNPDVVCFQEFLKDYPAKTKHVSSFELMKNIGYPYWFYAEDYILHRNRYSMGVAIFSKYPITDSFRIRYGGTVASMSAESLIATDIMFKGKPIRIFSTHLQSNRLAKEEYSQVTSARGAKDSVYSASKTIVRKLKVAYQYRSEQAEKVAAALNASPHPEIITGDFNDIPNSYTYFRIKKNRVDAFTEKGWALGRTFSHISPTLRIDYILADKKFEVLQYSRKLLPYSDHYPIIADLRLRAE